MKKTACSLVIACLSLIIFSCSAKRSEKPRILVFSKTAGYRHASIPDGQKAIMKLGQENGFDVDTTEDASFFNEDTLARYSAVIFLSTTGNVLDYRQEAAFERYIQSGGGYVGVHAATDTEYDWGWYGRLAGAYFLSHPAQQEAKILVADSTHISTKHLPREWIRKDEWYNYKKLNPDVHVLLKLDETSYEGGKNGDNHPIAWYHEYDGGRAFYTGLGHTEVSYTEENFLKHLLGGIQYAIGKNNKPNYSKVSTQLPPDEDRFTKTPLVQGTFFEPTEMTILPNLDILVAQRRGELMLYKNADSTVKQAGFLDVYHRTDAPDVNAEEGFMGLQADPNFEKNHFVYLFYSPKDTSVNRLSRFKFENDSLVNASEHVILQFYSQRDICCHTGGSIAFGGDGKTLFLSTGDNSTPFNEKGQPYVNRGFAPLDDRPGHEQYDARRSSGNTNDLRGKILRIILKEDGSYEIPEDNLFPNGTADARPEIYVMGNRNPYRISVDKKKGWLYWGEVGPDANNDSLKTRGPKGYDEVNQARQAGNFGWPMFVGNNYAYHQYDYATGQSGPSFDPANPVNNSRNNTGLKKLPPAQPAFIWYPYAASPDFPQTGTGGRNAMAGPVYYTDMFPADTRLPDYYNKKLLIYDWIRGWIKAVSMLPNGDFDKMEPFMENIKLANLIDMEVGPDGRLYLLEYGTGWFTKNDDAGLSRIDYNGGNRAPKIESLVINKTSGALPFAITATATVNDPEKDPLTYIWRLGNNIQQETTTPVLEYTFDKAGDYTISLEVKDDKNAVAKSEPVSVYAGNEAPEVHIDITGNKTFYFPGKQVKYNVQVQDNEDATAIDVNNLVVSADYVEGTDMAAASPGHLVLTEAMAGKNLMLSLDCKTCHKTDGPSVGPSYIEVAKRYEKDPKAVSYLVDKIIKGGGGVWGETAMAAHPNLSEADARKIVSWIQSLTKESSKRTLPPSGTIPSTLNKPVKENGILYITATYTDKGGSGQAIRSLTGSDVITLRNSKLSFNEVDSMKGFTSFTINDQKIMITPQEPGWFVIRNIDLSGINSVALQAGWQEPAQAGYTFSLHIDSPEGQKIGEFTLPGGLKNTGNGTRGSSLLSSAIQAVQDGRLHNLYIVSKPANGETKQVGLRWIEFR